MWDSGWFVSTSVTTLFCKAWTYNLTVSHRDVVCISFTHRQVYRMFVSWGKWWILAFPVALGIAPRALSTQGSTMWLQPQSHLCFESRDRNFWIILSFPGWPWSQKSLIPGWPQTDNVLHQLPEELRPQVCLHHQAPLIKFSIFFLCGLGMCVWGGRLGIRVLWQTCWGQRTTPDWTQDFEDLPVCLQSQYRSCCIERYTFLALVFTWVLRTQTHSSVL